MIGPRQWLAGVAVTAALGALASPSVAQENFRITYNVERLEGGRTRVTGTVQNDARAEVLDVYVTAEALDGNKKVVARGISFVAASLRQRDVAPFTVSVPAPPTATVFRVQVTSYRMGLGGGGAQGP